MYKPITLVSFLIFTLFANTSRAQDELEIGRITATKRDTKIVSVLAFDGKTINVKIIPDYVHRELKMILSKDTLRVLDFWGVPPDIILLNKTFVQIDYAVRGGSNLGLGKTIILCVNNGRLYPALHCLKYSNWDSGDTADYSIKLALYGTDKSNYKLKVNVHDDVNSPSQPEENFTYNNETILSFDVRNNAFYSVKQSMYQNFIKKGKGKKSIKEKVGGIFPSVILGTESYYLVNRHWYTMQRSGELFEVE